MTDKELEKLMEEVARKAHEGQYRRDGITPYINHVVGVVNRLRTSTPYVRALGWGHDFVEDKLVTLAYLKELGVPDRYIEDIRLLDFSDVKGEDEYLKRVSELAFYEEPALVKLADNMENVSDKPSDKARAKYLKSIDIIISFLIPKYSGAHPLCD